jgi:hypothetical protein
MTVAELGVRVSESEFAHWAMLHKIEAEERKRASAKKR